MTSAEDGGGADPQSRRGGRIKRIKIWKKMKEMIKRTWKMYGKKEGKIKAKMRIESVKLWKKERLAKYRPPKAAVLKLKANEVGCVAPEAQHAAGGGAHLGPQPAGPQRKPSPR